LIFITVAQTGDELGLNINRIYYLLHMGQIEAVKIRGEWRINRLAVRHYAKSRIETGAGEAPGNPIDYGCGECLVSQRYNSLSDDTRESAPGIQRRERMEYSEIRSHQALQPQIKSVIQLDLFN